MDIRKVVGRNLLRLRQSKGLTQIGLSEGAEMIHAHVSGIERGRMNPTVNTLMRLAVVLGVEPCELLVMDEGEKAELTKVIASKSSSEGD